jgi:hypothetical protein
MILPATQLLPQKGTPRACPNPHTQMADAALSEAFRTENPHSAASILPYFYLTDLRGAP